MRFTDIDKLQLKLREYADKKAFNGEIEVANGILKAKCFIDQECTVIEEKQLNNGWIPVSEKLPDECGLGVLFTIENKFQQRKVIQGFTGYMEKGKLEFHTNDKTTNLEAWKVIAWQHLPPAWKGESNG